MDGSLATAAEHNLSGVEAIQLKSTLDIHSALLHSTITIQGRIRSKRVLGKLAFVEIVDQDGKVQVVTNAPQQIELIAELPYGTAVCVCGQIRARRPANTSSDDSGKKRTESLESFEIWALKFSLASVANEKMGLDVSPKLNVEFVHEFDKARMHIAKAVRSVLYSNGFIEIPAPCRLEHRELQSALLFLESGFVSNIMDGCSLPPLRTTTQRAALSGLDRFFYFFEGDTPLTGLLHIGTCFSNESNTTVLMREILNAIWEYLPQFEGRLSEFIPEVRFSDMVNSKAAVEQTVYWITNLPVFSNSTEGKKFHSSRGFFCASRSKNDFNLNELSLDVESGRHLLVINNEVVGEYANLAIDYDESIRRASIAASSPEHRRRLTARLVENLSLALPPVSSLSLSLDRLLELGASASSSRVHKRSYVTSPKPERNDRGRFEVVEHLSNPSPLSLASSTTNPTDDQTAALLALMDRVEKFEVNKEREESYPSKTLVLQAERSASVCDIADMLKNFSMSLDQAEVLVKMLMGIEQNQFKYSANQLFQIIWSLLGSENVKYLTSDNESRLFVFDYLIKERVLTEKRQLLYIYPTTIANLKKLLKLGPASSASSSFAAHSIKLTSAFFRTVLAKRPTEFSTILQSLCDIGQVDCVKADDDAIELALNACDQGAASPIFFRIYVGLRKQPKLFDRFLSSVKKASNLIFPNIRIDPNKIKNELRVSWSWLPCDLLAHIDKCPPDKLTAEVIYFLFRPVTLDFSELYRYLTDVVDCTSDVYAGGIINFGEHWLPHIQCYRCCIFAAGERQVLRFYLSKNQASFFAKSSAGICTAGNTSLYSDRNHFHLNLVDESTCKVVGNVQLYVYEFEQRKALIVRGINPSASYVSTQNAKSIVDAVLNITQELAAINGFSGVYIAEQLGLWNADSSRAEIRAALSSIYLKLTCKDLSKPFLLYNYFGKDLWIRKCYIYWSSEGVLR